jgi:hypothetical protein
LGTLLRSEYILTVPGLALKVQDVRMRTRTLEKRLKEERDDQGLDHAAEARLLGPSRCGSTFAYLAATSHKRGTGHDAAEVVEGPFGLLPIFEMNLPAVQPRLCEGHPHVLRIRPGVHRRHMRADFAW